MYETTFVSVDCKLVMVIWSAVEIIITNRGVESELKSSNVWVFGPLSES